MRVFVRVCERVFGVCVCGGGGVCVCGGGGSEPKAHSSRMRRWGGHAGTGRKAPGSVASRTYSCPADYAVNWLYKY